ncbi:MAG: hypothetical protein HY820_04335 [Acidobacteria bacterium]|nr:hypothetical protein [Acidobacteriota bacterium]
MSYDKLLVVSILFACGVLTADVRTPAPPDPGPPEYSFVQRMLDGSPYVIHDGEWAAVVFYRDPNCAPANFNLLDTVDLTPAFPGGPPRPFLCPLTVSGLAIWKNGPPPIDFVPIQVVWHGLGSVPVWFAKLAEIRAAATDDNLTIAELLALPSLRKGHARIYEEVTHPGAFRPQGFGNGSIEIAAAGVLEDGRSFQIEWVEMGKKDGGGASYLRHGRIEFK